jgi:hypothetical protein
MFRSIWLLLGIVIAVALIIGFSDSTQRDADVPSTVAAPARQVLSTRLMKVAVMSAAANARCGYSDVGYAHNTPREAARQLVQTMNSAVADLPGDINTPGPKIAYVLERPDKAWQVAVIGDEAAGKLRLEGYAIDLRRPVVVQEVPCR